MSSSLLDNLPPRPPTPPRETHNEATAAQCQVLTAASIDGQPNVHTPPGITSPSSAENSTSRRRKKVGFSAKAEYQEPPVYPDGLTRRPAHPTPVSLPRSASKPVKSILKVTNYVPSPLEYTNGDSTDPTAPFLDLATMLESSIQMLAGGERHAKVDAYTMLPRALRASNNLPDRVALQDKMGLLMQFIQRDITSKTPDGSLDLPVVKHVLVFLKTLHYYPSIYSKITNDFAVFIVDHCIRSFEDPSVPKDIARHLMQIMIIQNFSNKVLTADRVGRLVASLRHIEEHLQGKSIVMSRVLIYKKLVKQVRPLMVIHSDWLFDLFTDMLSTVKDIRSAAIALGFDAAFRIGHEKQLSRKVMEIFKVTLDDQRYIEYYEEKLKAMNQEKHESAAVPQIWSVVVLLLRVRLDEWDRMHTWLTIIEKCFNSPSPTARVEANHAWNRLVYLMQSPDDVPLVKNLATLRAPLLMQLKRKGPNEEIRRAVFSSICYLIYYTLKPNTNPALLDQYWDISIKPVISKLLDPNFEPAEEYLNHACAILSSLFDCTTARLWKANRIDNSSQQDVTKPEMKPEELPAIDSKWIRRNASKVFATVQPVLARKFLGLADRKSPTFKLWESLVGAVASAASKEIKVSKDTATFVAEALNVLQGVWRQGILVDENAQPVADKFLVATRTYIEVMVSSLGLLPFTEKPGKAQAHIKAPLYQLFSMLSALPPGIPDDSDFAQFLGLVFAPFFGSKGDKAKMDLAQDMLQTIPMEAPRPYGPWLLVAGKILTWLEPTSSSHQSTGSGSGSENPVGHDYRDVVKVLERGIKSTPNLPWDHWEPLFHALYERARDETGDAGVAIVAIEPLAKVLLDQLSQRAMAVPSANTIRCVVGLMSLATHPRDRQAVDSARRRLWGTVLAGPRSTGFDTFDNFYKVVNEALVYLYEDIESSSSDAAVPLLKELGGFFDRCNRQLFLKTMIALQDGFLPWLQDAKRLLGSQNSGAFAMVKALWDRLSSLLSDTEKLDAQLDSLDRLFCATFGSSHRCIVNSSVSLWNRLFEHAEHLDYPEKLKAALVQVQPHADIILPGLDVSSAEYAGQQPPFVESLDDYSLPKMPYTRSSRRGTPLPTAAARSGSPMPAKRGASARLVDTTPTAKSTRVTRRNPAPRLRHDDSQLQFAAIVPSPVGRKEVESQVLTERQREVRERQKETTALFPEIRSSPGPKSKLPTHVPPTRMSSPGKGHNSQVRIAVTPEPDGGYDDYVSSTPTPRRGQPIHIPDHDMMDPPSSPPEPIGNPLAAEIRSRSASNSLLDDWQFSSSPVSGSPNPDRQATILDSSGQGEDITMSDVDEELPHSQHDTSMAARSQPEPATEIEIIEESVIIEPPKLSPTVVKLDPIGPHTPSKNLRSAQRQETPKSDNDVFVDAPTSPILATPRRTERVTRSAARSSSVLDHQPRPPVNTSFEDISDVDERSLLRLVVELDAVTVDTDEYNRTTASPEKKEGVTEKAPSPRPLECIVVVGEVDSPAERPTSSQGSARKTRSSSAALSSISSSEDVEQSSSSQSQSKGRSGRGKRKRALSKTSDTGNGGKKRKQHDSSSGSEPAEVPDSQPGSQAPEAIPDDGGVTIPSSLPEFPSQESFGSSEGSQGSVSSVLAAQKHRLEEGDVHMGEQDDQDVQSQIALESQQSLSQQERMHEESPTRLFTPSGSQARKLSDDMCGDDKLEELKAEVTRQEEDSQMGEAEVDVVTNNDKISNEKETALEGRQQGAEALQPRQEEPQRVLKPVQKIMGILRNGLDMLRSASLSRQEVYQIEDMFMDMKKELYIAESRGRSRSISAGGEEMEEGDGGERA